MTPPPVPTPVPWHNGMIDNDNMAAVSHMEYTMTNGWMGQVNGDDVRIDAGGRNNKSGLIQDDAQGVIVITTYSIDGDNAWGLNWSTETIDAPIPNTGVLTITAVTNNRLTLRAKNGAIFYFDVPTRRFVDSLAAAVGVPTVTPLPTALPTRLTIVPFSPPANVTPQPYPYP